MRGRRPADRPDSATFGSRFADFQGCFVPQFRGDGRQRRLRGLSVQRPGLGRTVPLNGRLSIAGMA